MSRGLGDVYKRQMRSLNDILADCRVAFSQMSESEQASAAQALVGKNAMSGFLAVMNAAPSDIEKLNSAISTCSDEVDGYNGVTEKMAAVMQDNLGGQLTILKSQLEELAISFGEILMPAIRAIVSKIQALVDKLNQMDPATKETIVKIALVAAALGPLLVVVGKTMVTVGKLMQFISNLPTIIAGAKAAFSSFGAAIGGISAPVVAVIAVIAALVAAFVHLWKTNDEFRAKITAIWEQIKGIFQGFCQGIVDRLNALGFDFENIGEVIKAVWEGLCNFLAPIFEGVFQQIANIFKAVTDILLNVLDIFIGIFTGDWDKVWDGIKGIFVAVWNFLKDTLQNYMNAPIPDLIDKKECDKIERKRRVRNERTKTRSAATLRCGIQGRCNPAGDRRRSPHAGGRTGTGRLHGYHPELAQSVRHPAEGNRAAEPHRAPPARSGGGNQILA